MDPLTIGLLSAGVGMIGGLFSNRSNAREARRNREFQERMSSTAHQREVDDLRAAGINPMMRHMSGASQPSGDRAEMRDITDGGRGISEALMMREQVKLLRAQTERERASGMLIQQQRFELEGKDGMGVPGRTRQALSELDLEQRKQMLPLVLKRAAQEIDSMVSSARAAEARALLDEAALASAENFEKFAERLGEFGPAVQFALELLRALRGRR